MVWLDNFSALFVVTELKKVEKLCYRQILG
jgi:hypothetical protein